MDCLKMHVTDSRTALRSIRASSQQNQHSSDEELIRSPGVSLYTVLIGNLVNYSVYLTHPFSR